MMTKLPRLKDSALEQRLDILGDKLDEMMCLLRKMEKVEMSRYTDILEKVRAQTTRIAALRELIKGLDGGTEAEYQAAVAAILGNTAEIDAAITENTPQDPGGGSTTGIET